MCRAFLLYGKGEKYPYLLTYFINSFNQGNVDGFFLGVSDKINIRTMSFKDLLHFMRDNKELIDKEELVFGHARLATNKVCERNIHGWNLNGYYCYHNGINDIKDNKNDNDSWDFFKHVFRGQCKSDTVWQRFIDEINERGNGAYFMVNPSKNVCMIAGTTIDVNIHLVNKKLVMMNSNDDIHKFDEKIKVKRKVWHTLFGLDFYETKEVELDYELPKIMSDIDMSLDYEAICIYKEGKEYLSFTTELKKGYKYGNYANNYNDWRNEYGKKNDWGANW